MHLVLKHVFSFKIHIVNNLDVSNVKSVEYLYHVDKIKKSEIEISSVSDFLFLCFHFLFLGGGKEYIVENQSVAG